MNCFSYWTSMKPRFKNISCDFKTKQIIFVWNHIKWNKLLSFSEISTVQIYFCGPNELAIKSSWFHFPDLCLSTKAIIFCIFRPSNVFLFGGEQDQKMQVFRCLSFRHGKNVRSDWNLWNSVSQIASERHKCVKFMTLCFERVRVGAEQKRSVAINERIFFKDRKTFYVARWVIVVHVVVSPTAPSLCSTRCPRRTWFTSPSQRRRACVRSWSTSLILPGMLTSPLRWRPLSASLTVLLSSSTACQVWRRNNRMTSINVT